MYNKTRHKLRKYEPSNTLTSSYSRDVSAQNSK